MTTTGSTAGSKRSWASGSWQQLQAPGILINSLITGSRVDGVDFQTGRLDAITEFVIDQQDIFTCMGGAKPEDLHTWIDAFATVGSLGGQVSISSAIIEERLATTNAVREATVGCRKELTALRLKGTSSIQEEIKTHLSVG